SAGKAIYSRVWRDVAGGTAGEARFEAAPPDPSMQVATGREGDSGPYYAYARLRPDIPAGDEGPPFARHALFLLDTSSAESPERFARCVRLLRAVLEKDSAIEHFNVLTFSTGAAWLSPGGWLANTKEVREKALAKLDGIALEGATDLSAALEAVASLP